MGMGREWEQESHSCTPPLPTSTSSLAGRRRRAAPAARWRITEVHRHRRHRHQIRDVVRRVLNARCAMHKAALIHDVIADHRLDVLALTETWIPSDAPNAVKLDVAATGLYSVVHRHRGSLSAVAYLCGIGQCRCPLCW